MNETFVVYFKHPSGEEHLIKECATEQEADDYVKNYLSALPGFFVQRVEWDEGWEELGAHKL